jgi:hypothetical protein
MKIEIDLDDIFRDGDGNPEEGLEESVRRQVIDRLSGDMRKRLFAQLDVNLTTIMNEQINAVIKDRMPELLDDILNTEYTPVSTYGIKAQASTTFRAEIIAAVANNMKYEPKGNGYDENAFTKAVKSIVNAQTAALQKEILARVDTEFKKDAMAFAVAKLSERLGLPK